MADLRVIGTVKNPGRATADVGYVNARGTRTGELFTADFLTNLAMQGRIFVAHPGAAQNTVSTGAAATSFVATTPDFTLEVPTGTTCIPLRVTLQQAGTVAGAFITVVIAIQNAAERSSAGTAFANILSTRTDGGGITRACVPYTAPTVSSDTVGVAVYRQLLLQSVTTGKTGGTANDVDFAPLADSTPLFLVGPAALKVYTWASGTAPSWFAQMAWAEIPSADIT